MRRFELRKMEAVFTKVYQKVGTSNIASLPKTPQKNQPQLPQKPDIEEHFNKNKHNPLKK